MGMPGSMMGGGGGYSPMNAAMMMGNPYAMGGDQAYQQWMQGPISQAGWQQQNNNWQPSAAPTYQPLTLGNLNKWMPQAKDAAGLGAEALAYEASLPEYLKMGNFQDDKAERAKWESVYRDEKLLPQINDIKSQLVKSGRMNSSFGGGQVGSAWATGVNEAMKAGESMFNSRFNQLMQKRSSWFGGEQGVANQAESNRMARGNQVGSLMAQGLSNQNNFNMQAWQGQNQFGMGAQNAAWGRQNDIWNRDQQLWGRANTAYGNQYQQNKGMGGVFGAAGQAGAGAMRAFG